MNITTVSKTTEAEENQGHSIYLRDASSCAWLVLAAPLNAEVTESTPRRIQPSVQAKAELTSGTGSHFCPLVRRTTNKNICFV